VHVVGAVPEQKSTKETKNSGGKRDRDKFNIADSNYGGKCERAGGFFSCNRRSSHSRTVKNSVTYCVARPYYMISPDQLSERNVEDYILYVRDELGVAKGTFAPLFFGLKFFYFNTLGYDWPLFTKKKSASHADSGCPMSAATRTAAA
jgi:hypothetical protein